MKFYCHKVESTRNCKLRQLAGRFQTLTWRHGETVQTQESPRLFGRVDSTAFLPSGLDRNHHCKSKSQHSILEVTFYWAAHESNAQSRNTIHVTLAVLKKTKWRTKLPGGFVCPIPPFNGGQFLQGGDGSFQVISGHLAKAKLLLGVIGPISLCTDCPSPQ